MTRFVAFLVLWAIEATALIWAGAPTRYSITPVGNVVGADRPARPAHHPQPVEGERIMIFTTLGSTIDRAQWRLLNHLYTAHERGLTRRNVRVLLATEDGVWSDLIEIQDCGLVDFWFGDKPIGSDNLATLFRAEKVEVSLNAKGVRIVTGDPRNRVIRALAGNHSGTGRPIREVKKIADCGDDLLKDMNGVGLIEPYPDAANIRLEQFSRLPEHLLIRLAARGREFAPN